MTSTVYLDRDNAIRLELLQDDATVSAGAITKAALRVPGNAFADGVAVTYDTTGPYMSLADDATVVVLELGDAPIQPGFYVCLLTIYDPSKPDGLAWSEVNIQARKWAA